MLPVYPLTDTRLINSGLDRYIPMMISRMIISLKKVACSKQTHIGGVELSNPLETNLQNSYAPHPVDSIRLNKFN